MLDIISDLEETITYLKTKQPEDRNLSGYNRLLVLLSYYRPKENNNTSLIIKEIEHLKKFEAIKYIRTKLRLSLLESKDFYESKIENATLGSK